MKPKTSIIAVLFLLAVVGLIGWGRIQNKSTTASVQGIASTGVKSELTASLILYDFGTISMKNGNVTKDFTFTNSTNKDIIIRGLETSCMCTSAFLVEPDGRTKGPFGMAGMGGLTKTNETVKPGENRTLRVVYDPNAHGPAGVGQIDRFVTITEASGNKLRFEIKALVKP